jgi:signal transduction histidine kinase
LAKISHATLAFVRLPFRRPSALLWLVAAALILLPVLAVLQYRWIGQLSDAERERRERTLRHATTALTQDVDIELIRAFIGLRVDGVSLQSDTWTEYAERVAGWRAAAAAPAIVRDVLLIDRDATGIRLRRWSKEQVRFIATPWTAELDPHRVRALAELGSWNTRPPDEPRPPDLLSDDGSAIVAPIAPVPVQNQAGRLIQFDPVFGYVIIRFDMRVMIDEFLPALMNKHFRHEAADEYRIAVVSRRNPSQVIYRVNVDDVAALVSQHDAEAEFFGFKPDQFQLVRMAADSMRNALSPNGDRRRSLFFSIQTRRPPDPKTAGGSLKPLPDDSTRWRLVARHRAGSLEAAVRVARLRNLALSFGVLLLMFGSVAVLAVTAERAERLARQQIEFVAAVSHELRTPVSVIGAAAENLADGLIADPSRVKQYGARIQTESRRLAETVERVLLYAGIEAGRAVEHRAPVDISSVVADALAACSDAITEAGVTVETDLAATLPPVLADRAALRASLQNLIANGLKYGGTGRWLRVSVTTGRGRRGDEVRLAVSDRGLGIAPADLPHIFEPFYRGAEAQTRQIRGNGLGLSIVKGIVDAHGGRVTVESAPGSGSTFVIHLPASRGEASTADAMVGQVGATARGA